MSTSEIRAINTLESPASSRLEEIKQLVAQDPEYQQLLSLILNGFPSHKQHFSNGCKRFWSVKEHLSVDDGLIVYRCCLLIPIALDIHSSHHAPGVQVGSDKAALTLNGILARYGQQH